MLCILALVSIAVVWAEGLIKSRSAAIVCFILAAAAFAVRAICMTHETLDYQDFLTVWVDFFRSHGGLSGLGLSVGNYNVPYLFFLALFSYSGIRDLFLIKLLSVAFDIVLAWAAMRLAGALTKSRTSRLIAFWGTLLLPTVVLNGAYWGQCDSIYASLAVLSVYLALDKKPWLSVVSIAFSFAFKLQAIFIMPLFFVFLYTGRMKIYHLLAFPAAYTAAVMPAVLAGRPLADTLMIYLDQAGSVGGGLNYNSSSVFAFATSETNSALWSKLGVAVAFAFCVMVFVWFYLNRRRVTDRALLGAALLFAVGLPFLLPHMHDRYFFIADGLSFVLAVVAPVYLPVPVGVSFASLLGYHAYLKLRYFLPMSYGACALIIVLLLTVLFSAFSMTFSATNGELFNE